MENLSNELLGYEFKLTPEKNVNAWYTYDKDFIKRGKRWRGKSTFRKRYVRIKTKIYKRV